MKQTPAVLEFLSDQEKVVSLISDLTNKPETLVLSRLREEYSNPGINVVRDFKNAGLEPFRWSKELSDFYNQTDAFLYELVFWNRNKLKNRMRRWISRHLAKYEQGKLNILCIGDGLGIDSAYLANQGHNVEYFEVKGYSESFARRIFTECKYNITIINEEDEIKTGFYDVVICLDVLEHIPNPPKYVKKLSNYLRQGGRLIVHSPFYMIHPNYPTHLKDNRQYSGRLSLYTNNNLALVEGEITWNPIVLEKIEENKLYRHFNLKIFCLIIASCYLSIGRFSSKPFWWVDSFRRKRTKWFGE